MASLASRLVKNSRSKLTAVISKSTVFGKKEFIPTQIPGLNIALSGSVKGGLPPGLITIAGKSRHFKTNYALVFARTFQERYPEGVVLFYDSEFGSPPSYLEAAGLDMDRVVHTPITNLEELKFDSMNQLENLEPSDNVFIIIDSVGNLASKREVDNALKENSAADMTRAKEFKGYWRMVTPILNLKNVTMVAIQHTYDTMEMYSQEVVSGGQGGVLSSDIIWTLGRQQEQDTDKKLAGYRFVINIYKSRYVKEKSKIPITVTFKGGIYKWSGIFDIALEGGFIRKVTAQTYELIDPETGEVLVEACKRKTLEQDEHMQRLVDMPKFDEYVQSKYKVVHDKLIREDTEEDEPLDMGDDDE